MACSLTVRALDYGGGYPIIGASVTALCYAAGQNACGGPVVATKTGTTDLNGEVTWDTTGVCSSSYFITIDAGECWLVFEFCQNSVVDGGNATDPVFTCLLTRTNATGCEYDCLTCELTLQVHDACDGSGIGGATVTLTPGGGSCTTAGGGGCTINDIQAGDYTYTVEVSGYGTVTGSFTCACGGGSTTVSVNLTPTGGCDTCDLTITVIDYCTGTALSGVTVTVDGVPCTTGAPGTCSFSNLANGDHTVVISKTGYNSQTFTWRCTGGDNGSFTVALVPLGGCVGDPPNNESLACLPLAFGAMERRGLRFGTPVRDTTPEFGAAERRGLRFGRMKRHGQS